MIIHTNITRARVDFGKLWEMVIRDRDVVVIQRCGAEDVALISADELAGLLDTVYLLRSPSNARRLHSALRRALTGNFICGKGS